MKELIVGGDSGTHYIIEVNGEKKMVSSGEVVRFESEAEASDALENTRIIGGELLFREKTEHDEAMIEHIPVVALRQEGDEGIVVTSDETDQTNVEKRELKQDGKNKKNG